MVTVQQLMWVVHTFICVLRLEFDVFEVDNCFPCGPHNRHLNTKLLSLPFELSCSKNDDILGHFRGHSFTISCWFILKTEIKKIALNNNN